MRKYASDFTVTLGPIQMVGSLYPLVKSDHARGSRFRRVVPNTDTPTLARQVYVAENEIDADQPRLYNQSDLGYAIETVDGLAFVDRDEVTEARTSTLPLNLCDVSVHRSTALNWDPQPTGTIYAFVPNVANEHYAALRDALCDPDYIYLSVANVRNAEGLFRLTVMDHMVVMQKLHWPEDLNDVDSPDVESSPELSEAVASIVRAMASMPSDDMYVSGVRQRVEAVQAGEVHVPDQTERHSPRSSLLEALQEFLPEDN